MKGVLSKKFFERDTLVVAEELIGKFLVRAMPSKNGRPRKIEAMITEVEGYDGHLDKASHASRGKTKRNEPMFGAAGVWYVYLCYGVHEMLNIATGVPEYPAAVLIRSVEGVQGPGRVTKKFMVGRALNAKEASKKSGLWIEDRGVNIAKKDVQKTPRIGVDYAGPVWSKKHYRFVLK